MSKFPMSVFISLLLFGLLISGIACSKTVIIIPPAQTATPTRIATPTQTATPIQTSLTSLDFDLHRIKGAVDAYVLQAGEWPTADGALPAPGNYTLIDFNATFDYKEGKIMSFYPDFISRLPRHWDEGVWRLDSAALVSVNMNPSDY